MRKSLFVMIWVFVIELLTIVLLIPGNWTDKIIKKESVLIEQNLGTQTNEWIQNEASKWYQSSIIESGVYDAMYDYLIPTEEQKNRSTGLENMGKVWFKWVKQRLDAFFYVVYQFYTRFALFLIWMPYICILLIPAIYDGFMSWQVKRTNFDYVSPILHRYGTRGLLYVIGTLLIAFFSPIVLNPIIIPISMMVCCMLIGVVLSNFQKRI